MKTTLDGAFAAPLTGTMSPQDAERLQVLQLVEQFEGMLLTEMLRDVRAGDEDDGGFGLGASTMTDTMQGEFGLALSRSGGLGLGEMLAKALLKKASDGQVLEAAGAAAGHAHDQTTGGVAPGALPTASAPGAERARPGGTAIAPGAAMPTVADLSGVVADPVPVSSAFGWRHDPFTGQAKFHKGVDLAAKYGSEVRAFGGGVVKSAGEQSGYGLTVVVDHGGGRETLYAHLSSLAVTAGQAVEAGQPIARSGNSGRATGAHLHFEAREYGRAVDGRRVAAAWNDRASDTSVGGSDD